MGICAAAENVYDVQLGASNGKAATIALTVDETKVAVVSWPESLEKAMQYNTSAARSVFEAVLAFHQARKTGLELDLVALSAARHSI